MTLPYGAWVGLLFIIVVFPDHTHLLFLYASGEDPFMSSAGDKAFAARICDKYQTS